MKLFCLLLLFCVISHGVASEPPTLTHPARVVTSYALTSAANFHWNDPSAWRLLASNDSHSWTVLDIRTNQNRQTAAGHRQVYYVQNITAYRIYRLQIDGSVNETPRGVELAEVELIGPVVGVENEISLEATISASRVHPLWGSAFNAFDGDVGTKWIDFAPFKEGVCWIQCEYVHHAELTVTNINQLRVDSLLVAPRILMAEKGLEIQSNLTASVTQSQRTLTGYALTSANDYPDRDPRDWQLLGSKDGGKTWEVVDVRRNEIFSSRFQRRVFALNQSARYGIYRLRIGVAGLRDRMQLAELEPLYAEKVDNRNCSLAILSSAENPPMETTEMAFDGDQRSKWLCFLKNNNQPVWLQWQCLPAVEGLPLINLSVFARGSDRGRIVPTPTRIKRTLTGYSLISASDEPSRDPRDWHLLGSTDGGSTWDILDIRTNEVFKERSQKRLFSLSKPAVSALFRLQFDSVAEPANANSIQLAEIEPFYAPAETNRQYTVVVSALGENTPSENIENLFDGDLNSKWLDFSQEAKRVSWVQWYFKKWDNLPVTRADSNFGIQPALPQTVKAQLEGVVVCASSNVLGFLDESGFQMFQMEFSGPTPAPGDQVRLTGRLQFGGRFPKLNDPEVAVIASLTNQGEIRTGQPIAGQGGVAFGSVEGRVTAVSEGPIYTTLRLAPDSRSHVLVVRILNSKHALLPAFANSRLRVQGVIESVYDERGEPYPGIIWADDVSDVTLAPPTEEQWIRWPIFPLASLGSNAFAGQLVRTRGDVVRQEVGAKIVIGLGTNQLNALCLQTNILPSGSMVEVAGFYFRTGAIPELRMSYARLVGGEAIAGATQPSVFPSITNELTTIRQINEAIKSQPNREFNVKVRGVITYIDLGLSGWYLQDGVESIYVFQQDAAGLSPFVQMEGMYIELQGTVRGGNEIGISPTAFLKVLGKGRMPVALRHSLDYLMTGNDDGKWVQFEGVVTAFEKQRLTLNVNGGQVIVWVNEMDRSDQDRLLGSVVRVSGVCAPLLNNRRQRLGIRLLVPSADYVEMIDASPENPFDLPTRSIDNLMQAGPGRVGLTTRLVKITGVVTHREPQFLFVQNETNGVRVVTRQEVVLEPGDSVEVVGLAEMDGLSPKLVQALVRKKGRAALPVANPIDLLGTDSVHDQASRDATRGSVEATLLGVSFNESAEVLHLKQEKTDKTFFAYLPLKSEVSFSVPLGSRVRLEGAFKAKTDSVPDFGQVITSFEMYLNSPSDIVVLERPPWWTAQRTLWVLTGLGAVLFLALAWGGLLRNQVRRRTRELQAEIIERQRMENEMKKTHRQLLEASRQAGMAEVAISVLHNVGNVLNSINVSSDVIADRLRESKGNKLAKVVALMNEHATDLGEFITQHVKGRLIPSYLDQLAKHLDTERDSTLKEIDGLKKNIEHINEIVAMQQSYARGAILRETINLTELVEDALNINAATLTRRDVKIVRDYDKNLPDITVEKHKVLQILVNVIRNAKNACDESGRSDKQINLCVRSSKDRIDISVADNGIGIPPENLIKIFNHGFTTRQDGHGFGLHSSSLAAKDLGGTLSVESGGAGQGATFTLAIPFQPPETSV